MYRQTLPAEFIVAETIVNSNFRNIFLSKRSPLISFPSISISAKMPPRQSSLTFH